MIDSKIHKPKRKAPLHKTGAVLPIRPRKAEKILKSGEEAVRFVPLGGFEEIGRNMMFFEYKDEIVVIDAGLQFPEEETPGIDYIIPNTSYLETKKKNIKAMIV